ncbi:Fc.00g027080.m01.CDS01 [Cosmosporella sp. VM-42]
MPSQFWTRELLQLAHSEPAVWHATLALGALHQRRELEGPATSPDSRIDALSKQAIENHARAITYARELKDPTKLIALSLALVSITNMLGRWSESQVHIRAAHRLLNQSRTDPANQSAAEMLTRLDLQAMTFIDSSAPYPFREATWFTQVDHDMRQGEKLQNYGQAGTALFALCRRLLLTIESLGVGNINDEEASVLMEDLMRDLVAWEFRMSFFERQHPPRENWDMSIRLYHSLLRLMAEATAFGPETRWDRLLGYFERMIACTECLLLTDGSSAARRPISLEPGVIIPLFLVVTRCRHPRLRRRALGHLKKLKRQEGMWSSEGAAGVAEKVVSIEEGDSFDSNNGKLVSEGVEIQLPVKAIPWEAWSAAGMHLPAYTSWAGVEIVPEIQRVRETMVLVRSEQRVVDLTFIMCSGDDLGTFGGIRTEVVNF